MIAARKWRAEHRCAAAEGHMPFPGHRTVAEIDRDEHARRVDRLIDREMEP